MRLSGICWYLGAFFHYHSQAPLEVWDVLELHLPKVRYSDMTAAGMPSVPLIHHV